MKTLIKNATIVDGSGKPAYEADLLIKDDKIEKIGQIGDTDVERTIDAKGLVVAPIIIGGIVILGRTV